MADCKYPQCCKCEFDYCIKDSPKSKNKPQKRADRTEYYKEYYQRKKEGLKAKRTTKTRYIRYGSVCKEITKIKKKIGQANYEIVMAAIDQIEKE